MKTWLVFFMVTALAMTAEAEIITPSSADTVIATWSVTRPTAIRSAETAAQAQPNDSTTTVSLAKAYLAQAAQPGQAHFYSLAQAQLKPLIQNSTDSAGVWMAWAQVQQHQHAFDDALTALSHVLKRQPNNINAHLLAARIYLIKNDPTAARAACLKLLGHADLLTTSACALEVASLQNELVSSYRQLGELVARHGLPQDERGPWLTQILADMALRLNDAAAAEKWLDQQDIAGASVNFLGQWADVQLILNQPQNVLGVLQPIVEKATVMDDALLLRLALAENRLEGEKWKSQLHVRMAQREQRADTQHASELARYYLDINIQPRRALHWAQINWQSAKEHSDHKLLERATAVAQKNQKELQ